MRVLYISPYAPARDGIGDYTALLARGVRERGHDVRVVSARGGQFAPAEVVAVLPRSRAGRANLVALIATWRADVVHVQFAVAAYGGATPSLVRLLGALRAQGERVVVTLHEVTRDTALLRAPGRALYRALARRADVVIVHTDAALSALTGPVGARPVRAAVIEHPPAELPAASASAAELRARHGLEGARVLLALGFVHVDKGLGDLVDALARLRASGAGVEDVRLVVAGDVRRRSGAFRVFEARDRAHLAAVRRRIARLGLARHVTFTGYVQGGELRPWLELAEAAVLPYRRIEQSGIAALAQAAGCPVLASDVGGLSAHVSDPRRLFPTGDPGRLAAVLAEFLAAPREGRGPPAVANSMAAILDATLALYEPAPPRRPGEGRAPQRVQHA